MEVPNLLPAPSFSPVRSLLVLFLSILLAFCTFVYYHRFGYSPLSCPRGSQPSSNTQSQGAAGKRARRKRKGKAKARSKAMAAVGSSSLLDNGVEAIPVPILHPKATHAAEESQSSDSALLDRRLEHLMIPILEPVRVNNHQTLSACFSFTDKPTVLYRIQSPLVMQAKTTPSQVAKWQRRFPGMVSFAGRSKDAASSTTSKKKPMLSTTRTTSFLVYLFRIAWFFSTDCVTFPR